MEENKYYTPKIEELLEAIIYKETIYSKTEEGNIIEFKGLLNIEDTLHTFIEMNNVEIRYDENNEPVYYYFVNPELYLLKYLDKEDIESLGFKLVKEPEYRHLTKEVSLNYFPTNHSVLILSKGYNSDLKQPETRTEYWYQMFGGTIKNKSELKRLLKQLGIYEQ